MKVSIIEPVGAHGGMNYYDMGLANGLSNSGVEVTVYTCDSNFSAWLGQSNVVFSFRGIFGKRPMPIRALYYVLSVFYSLFLAKFHRSKIVHLHLFHYGPKELILALISRLLFFKVVATVHDVESFIDSDLGAIKRLIFWTIDRFVVHNEYSRSSLAVAAKLSSDLVDVIPHGNYCDYVVKMNRGEARRLLGLPENSRVILFFGQIKKVKALDLLIRSLPIINSELENVTLLVAGKYWKDSGDEYKNLIDELGLHSSVRLDIGYVPDDKVHLYYCSCDVVALPYREIFQSGVLLMAMSYARPVVVSNIAGMTDIVTHGDSGLVFKQEDPVDLAAQIVRVLSDYDLAERLSVNGLKKVSEEHCWNRVGQLTQSTYSKVLV